MIKVIIQIKHFHPRSVIELHLFCTGICFCGHFCFFSMNGMERELAMIPNGELDHTFRCENNFHLKDNMQQSLFFFGENFLA